GNPVVQDTAAGSYRDVPAAITYGYGTIAHEVFGEIDEPPTHAIVQAGVGGVASALCAQFWHGWGAARPRFVVLEPTRAACVAASLAAGRQVVVEGDTHTAMAGLACGTVSDIAWEVLETGADAALIAPDSLAFEGVRALARPAGDDPSIVAGECAGGAVGALLALAHRPDLRAALDITSASRVFVLGTEGATDGAIYEKILAGRESELA
ncbi:MAG: pyridoxal-phosphate dependent enzyme, partial [Pseudomonadota bacterium]